MLTKIKMMILLENATRDIESPALMDTCIRKARGRNHTKQIIQSITGYPSRPEDSEMPPSSVQSPASNVSNFSKESSILDVYEFSEF